MKIGVRVPDSFRTFFRPAHLHFLPTSTGVSGVVVTETLDADRDEFASWCERRDAARRIFERLSPREQEIAALAADGLSSRECADRLRISMKTVEKHRLSAYRRLDVPGLAGLIRIYLEAGFAGMNLSSSSDSDRTGDAAEDDSTD